MTTSQMNNEIICLEEAIKLWWIVVSHAPFLTPGISATYPVLSPILEANEDYITIFKRGLRVTQGLCNFYKNIVSDNQVFQK
jgi:hypothetical protein